MSLEEDMGWVKGKLEAMATEQKASHDNINHRLNDYSRRMRRLEVAHGLSLVIVGVMAGLWGKLVGFTHLFRG